MLGAKRLHSSHWGAFRAELSDGGMTVLPFENDHDPAPMLANIAAAKDHPARLSRPLVRRGWLEDGPGPDDRRGSDAYVEMDWEEALDLTARELVRLGALAGLPESGPLPGAHVFGGSYGWSSAGRFHHAQSQVHRFLNVAFGGYVASVDTYSSAAGAVILDLVCQDSIRYIGESRAWSRIRDHAELLIAFGGLPVRNMLVNPGGSVEHMARGDLRAAAERGCRIVSVSPLADDTDADLPGVTRIAPRPGTDIAMMLGMAQHLNARGLVDHAWLDRHTHGWEPFRAYLAGETDGCAKTPEWAAEICGVPAATIRELAESAASSRTHIAVSFALQRARNGEQPVWMGLVLSCMLGQLMPPGGGFSYGLASGGNLGRPPLGVALPTFPQGRNLVGDFIPVAKISDLLLNPGGRFTYKGEERTFADIRLVYWAGGNPFHHHQDLQRLRAAFARPETVIVQDSVGTATTAHADIVLPATITAERDDIGAGRVDPWLVPMQKLVEPHGEAKDDYDIFAALAGRIGCGDRFTEGRDSHQWQQHIYDVTRTALAAQGWPLPDFQSFMAGQVAKLPLSDEPGLMTRFHEAPEQHGLATPSGRIEISSAIVESAGLPAHPAWIEPEEWLGSALARRFPFQLVANQPPGRLHSQLDFGEASMAGKRAGREVARMNPDDAEGLGIGEGDLLLIRNDRGAFLAVARPDAGVASSIVQVPTGAWYAPVDLPGVGIACVNGNPNAVTLDIGASPLSGGCTGQLCLVSVEKWTGDPPPVIPHERILPRAPASPAG